MTASLKNAKPARAGKANAPLTGEVTIPGDKSISHRSFILGALASGTTHIHHLLEGDDVLATGRAMAAMGAKVEQIETGHWQVTGVGNGGLTNPDSALDFGNAGTGVRLVMGAMVGAGASGQCVGDASLSKRPMGRVIEPLTQMGAVFSKPDESDNNSDADKLPLQLVAPARALPLDYELPVPSAQVKSAILLAGLGAPGQTIVRESHPTRDHTERMLKLFGADIDSRSGENGVEIRLTGEARLTGTDIHVPGDPSSAAFPLVAALLVPHSKVTIYNVMVNPHRDGLWTCLEEMGAYIERKNQRAAAGEIVADFTVQASQLKGIDVPPERAPSMIDEYPILAMAAATARGTTHLTGLGELRVKESDRLSAVVAGLRANGVEVEEFEDAMTIYGCDGQVPGGGVVETHLDHRIAMSFLVLGLAAQTPITVDDSQMIATSFPEFFSLMRALNAEMEA
ncbi:MAG: 3-phosphoshikimate 1-carboxyvinyltransferase [Parvibaculales bacterium]